MGAAEGTLAIMAGGSEEAFERARPVLSVMGSKVVHAGPVGAGTQMKLARNLIHFVSFTAVTEAQRLAEAAGLDLRALGDVVRHTDAITGGPGAIMHRATTAPARPRRLLVRCVHPRARPGGEGPALRHRAGRVARRSTYPWPGWRSSGWDQGWDYPTEES